MSKPKYLGPAPALALALVTVSSAQADYTLSIQRDGEALAIVRRGRSIELDAVLVSDQSDSINSAIFTIVMSAPGLRYEAYAWAPPFVTGDGFDGSTPGIAELPVIIDEFTLAGPSHPAGVTDLLLSNATQARSFGEGNIATLSMTVPMDFAGPSAVLMHTSPDTMANGFIVVPTVPGRAFDLIITAAADVNLDQVVDMTDLVAILEQWGDCPEEGVCVADVDLDGIVDVCDLVAVILAWTE